LVIGVFFARLGPDATEYECLARHRDDFWPRVHLGEHCSPPKDRAVGRASEATNEELENDRLPPPSGKTIAALALSLDADPDELSALAGKIPADLVDIVAQNPIALKVFRSVAASMKSTRIGSGTYRVMETVSTRKPRQSPSKAPGAYYNPMNAANENTHAW
jgi:hypothetical protein